MTGLVIREVEVSDAEKIIDHFNKIAGESSFHTFGEGEYKTTIEMQETKIKSIKEADNSMMIVAELSKKIIGTASLIGGNRKKTCHYSVLGISIREKYCGAKIGSLMMERLIDFAQFSGLSKVNLMVHEKNIRAQKFYERLGFEEEGRLKRYFKDNEGYHEGICMGKSV